MLSSTTPLFLASSSKAERNLWKSPLKGRPSIQRSARAVRAMLVLSVGRKTFSKSCTISAFVLSSSSTSSLAILESQPSEKSTPHPLLILFKRMSFICLLVYRGPHILKYVLIAKIHRLASLLRPLKSSGRPAFMSTGAVVVDMSSSLSWKISKWSDSLSESEGSGSGGPEGVECRCNGKGRDVRDSRAAAKAHWKAWVLGEGGAEGWTVEEVERDGCASGGDGAVGVQKEPDTCLLGFWSLRPEDELGWSGWRVDWWVAGSETEKSPGAEEDLHIFFGWGQVISSWCKDEIVEVDPVTE